MKHRVVITGMGCVTPLGNSVKETWENLIAGKSGAGHITKFDSKERKKNHCGISEIKWYF